ncbi:Sodium/calcium exchanger regulatory protein 1 [Aphelenchoides besseyi]|nr:Sodium/calcium exchanger regulatory protein 1 [Aphelenchoides besseyi]KAI6220722.1 Sodium/calcium exchanger regulatory protein 1 [Aphelenchoides besseyi]
MTDEFVGRFELVESENFDAYMKAVGYGYLVRKMAATIRPIMEIKIEGSKWTIDLITTFKTIRTEFELGREFDEDSSDGRKLKSVCHFVDGRLIQKQQGTLSSSIERYFQDGKLYMILECEGVKATRIYKRL